MKRTTIYGLIITAALALASLVATAEDKKANVLLQAGIARETVQGDLKGAIEIYDKAVKEAGGNRALAAQAVAGADVAAAAGSAGGEEPVGGRCEVAGGIQARKRWNGSSEVAAGKGCKKQRTQNKQRASGGDLRCAKGQRPEPLIKE